MFILLCVLSTFVTLLLHEQIKLNFLIKSTFATLEPQIPMTVVSGLPDEFFLGCLIVKNVYLL